MLRELGAEVKPLIIAIQATKRIRACKKEEVLLGIQPHFI